MKSSSIPLGVLVTLMATLVPSVARAAVTGAIEGVVTDQATKKRLAGVTVTVTSPALQGEQSEFTDADGHFIITELPPGEYLVRLYYASIVVERPGVQVGADKRLAVNVAVPTERAKVQVYRITEKAPSVDVGNTQLQTQVSNELVRYTPVAGHSYQSVLTLAPGAATDPVGVSFSGATGFENNFLIDGVNTTNPARGAIGTQLHPQFIGDTEIITGGYNAEYGRSTGAVVNVLTKSGSNEFHGGVWINYTALQLRPSLGVGRAYEAIITSARTKYDLDVGFDLGGPILKDRIWFYAGFAPSILTVESERRLQARSADGLTSDFKGSRYLGDVDPSGGCASYLDPLLCTAKAYLMHDLGDGYARRYPTTTIRYNWIAKLNFAFSPSNHLSLQYIGSPATISGAQGVFNGSEGALLADQALDTHDASLHFVSKLWERRLQIDVIGGFHHEGIVLTPRDAAGGNEVALLDQRADSSLARYEPDIDLCRTQVIGGVSFNPCPAVNYLAGGFGVITNTIQQRYSASAAATLFVRLAGTHAFKIGGDFEMNRYTNHFFYTGGALWRSNADGVSVRRRTVGHVDDPTLPLANQGVIIAPEGVTATTATRNESLYVRDSWSVGFAPGLTVNAGLRWELQQVLDERGLTAIDIRDNLAPRAGVIYDFSRKGRSKLYASYGRFYESIPLDMNDRAFNDNYALLTQNFAAGLCTADATGRVNPATCNAPTPQRGDLGGGVHATVSPVLKGQFINEITGGLQYDIGWDVVLGAAYVHRDQGRIIEDFSGDGGTTFAIGNPGDALDKDAIADLQRKITASKDPFERSQLQKQLADYRGQAAFPRPRHEYNAMVLTAQKRLSHNFLLLASYTYSRTLGNYGGLFSDQNGQLDPNVSSQFDIPQLLINQSGPLPTDRPHNVKVSGSYLLPIGKSSLVFGLQFNAYSGRPISVIGGHPLYGTAEVFILPRGAGGRTPMVTQVDLKLSYMRELGRRLKLEASVDVFNVLNQQAVTNVDQLYALDNVNPIANGTVADLASLRNYNGVVPALNANYGHATQYQPPLSLRGGLRLSF